MNEFDPIVVDLSKPDPNLELKVERERQFRLGLIAAKQLMKTSGATGQLVDYLIDVESDKSKLRSVNLDNQTQLARLAVENLLLAVENEQLALLNMKDPLTGLGNRSGAKKEYDELRGDHTQERRRSDRKKPVDSQVLFIDIDNFKSVNDTQGHPAGDQLLIKVAEIISMNTRQNDIRARWGGDEFVVLMPLASRERADEAADDIQRELADFSERNQALAATISVGIGRADFNLTLEQTLELADRALLQAKRTGKNNIVHFDDITKAS